MVGFLQIVKQVLWTDSVVEGYSVWQIHLHARRYPVCSANSKFTTLYVCRFIRGAFREHFSRFLARLWTWTLEDWDPSSALSNRFVGIKVGFVFFPEKLHSGCICRQRARSSFYESSNQHMHTPGEPNQMERRKMHWLLDKCLKS